MKKKIMLAVWALVAVSITTKAQKLPKVQEAGIWAPANIKIDGKPTEWVKFQAYNNVTELFYTISNDNENVYLAIQAKDADIIRRMLGGGVTFDIQQSADKKDKNKLSITYPAYADPKAPVFSITLGHVTKMATVDPVTHTISSYTKVAVDTSIETRNTTMNMRNNLISQKLKWIGVKGIQGIDTLISIYNGDGIKVIGLFDNNEAYTLEMAVPLKNLNLSANNESKFNYHLQVNGIKGRNEILDGVPESVLQSPTVAQALARQAATTDFWGEYTLAKR